MDQELFVHIRFI